ncbi:hypothetical protein BRARA_A01091 [Brassica rapa]|uniref:Pentacotripeptide-repeat region of PRORP domain-containing protein n=1 Tax=Brassica campestris TaxID=3711 RepID=A0A398ASL7_BRACM|nr:hypothetical protein BRARA_A01091 [Brassica rapa]
MPKCPFPIRISSFLPQSRILSTNPVNLSTSISLSPNQSMEQPEVIEPPISHQMFKSAPKMGSFTQGDSTLSSTIESHAAKLDFASVENLLTRIRSENRTVREHTFIAIFKAYGKAHLPEKAVDLFHRMVCEFHCKRTVKSFNSVLNVVIKEGLYHRGLEFHDHVVMSSNMNICPNGLSFNLVIKALCKLGFVDRAVEVFRGMPERKCLPDVYTYCTLMDGLCKEERIDEAVLLLDEMQSEGISPSSVTYNVLINGLCKRGDLTRVTKLVDNMFLKGGYRLNQHVYSVLISGLFKEGRAEEAMSLWKKMGERDCKPNIVVYSALVDGLCREGKPDEAKEILNEMISNGCLPNAYTYSSLMRGLFKAGLSEEAIQPDVVTYNILLDGLCVHKDVSRAVDLLNCMLERGCDPDVITCNVFLKSLREKSGACEEGRRFLEELVVRLLKRQRVSGACKVVEVMLSKYMAPKGSTWGMIVPEICKPKKISAAIDKCWRNLCT